MRTMLGLLLLLLTAATPSTRGTTTLATNAEALWVPFERTAGNQIAFPALVDGVRVRAVLDTGVSLSVVSQALADRLRAKVAPRGAATAIGGEVRYGWMTTRSIGFGGLDRRGGGISVVALPAEATGDAQGADMLIGQDLIGGFALEIDYTSQRFRLLPSGRMPFRGATAPLSLAPDSAVYLTELSLGGQRVRPIIVDTGDGGGLTLSQAAWQANGPPDLPTTSTIAFGLGGPLVSALAILPSVAIGELEARDVELRVEPADGFSASIGTAGRIGSGLLERYHVLLDPRAGRMVLAPSGDAERAPRRSTSGLLTRREEARLRVVHVMRGSPAETSGWRAGEAICAVDGAAITAAFNASDRADWPVGVPGRTVSLGLCDGTTRQLTLRRFY